MTNLLEELRQVWLVILSIVGGIVWLVRLEGNHKALAEQFRRFEQERRDDMADAKEGRKGLHDIVDRNTAQVAALTTQVALNNQQSANLIGQIGEIKTTLGEVAKRVNEKEK